MFKIDLRESKVNELVKLLPIEFFVGEKTITIHSLQKNQFSEFRLNYEVDEEERSEVEELIRLYLLTSDFKRSESWYTLENFELNLGAKNDSIE